MARVKLAAEDQFLVWSATAPVSEVEAQYKRVGAVLATRRKTAPKAKSLVGKRKVNGVDTTVEPYHSPDYNTL